MIMLRLLVFPVLVLLALASCSSDGTSSTSTTTAADGVAAAPTESPAAPEADDHEHPGAVSSEATEAIVAAFDLLETSVSVDGTDVVFRSQVVAGAGTQVPELVGSLDQAPVWSYVWPTSLGSEVVGFEPGQGILALAATAHPDFDDTPLYDENSDGDLANDGANWHAHWVVLVEDEACEGGLSVKGIPEGETPTLPATWPELPILIDSPDLAPTLNSDTVEIRVPQADLAGSADFSFDGVTSGLRVSTTPHDPLLCVEAVFDIASGDLSLPGTVDQ